MLAGVGTGAGGGAAAGDLLMAGGVLTQVFYTIVAERFDDGSDALTLTTWRFSVPRSCRCWRPSRAAAGTGTMSAAPRFWLVAVLIGARRFGLVSCCST